MNAANWQCVELEKNSKGTAKYITSEKYTLWKAFILEGSMFAKSRISIPQKLPFSTYSVSNLYEKIAIFTYKE